MLDKFTVCITMGSRPELLVRTLESIPNILGNCRVLAVNDFGDKASNDAFKSMCPHGEIIELNGTSGHHPVVDEMYKHVKTDYVFHMEDDWYFDNEDFVEDALCILDADETISCVCFRSVFDFALPNETTEEFEVRGLKDMKTYYDLTGIHDEWYGYTFNPHIARLAFWERTGGFTQFKKERHISRSARALNCKVAFLKSGPCKHIGDGQTTNQFTLESKLKKVRTALRSFLKIGPKR